MKQHALDASGRAFQLGKNAEEQFVTYAQNKGWKVKPASVYENTKLHYDYVLTKDAKTVKVEVKSAKRINRGDSDTQTDLIWLEYLAGNGSTGWLMAEADVIAFQEGDTFLLIPRKKLVERAETLVTDQRARNAKDALYKLYTRFNRDDLLTMVKRSDIADLHEEL